jgi:photosystem II stability/assembly factor-like uncharacterized protein
MAKTTTPGSKSDKDYVYQFAASNAFGKKHTTCYAARLSGLYHSPDEGVTWSPAFTSLDLQERLSALAVVVLPDPEEESGVFIGLNGAILHSADDGQKWEKALLPSPPPVISALTISPNFIEDGILFAGTLEDGVLFSSDRGQHWVAWNFGLMDLNTLCLAISPNFASDETLFVGTQSGIFRSTNGGRAWREIDLPVGFEAVLSLVISPNFTKETTLFAGTENRGVLHSTDAGQTWEPLAQSVLTGPINSILLGTDYSNKPEILVLQGGDLLTSGNGGNTWKVWRKNELFKKEVTAVYAPNGIDPRAPALIGYADGTIQRI